MQLRADGPDVWYATEAAAFVGPGEIAFLKERAAESPRLRSRICLHENVSAPVHEMVIVHHRSCYVRPHRHPRKPESLTVLEGDAVALFFDDGAGIASAQRLAPDAATMCRVPVNAWHGLVIESEWFVFYEVSAGPFVPGSTEFAPWAPPENDPAASAFLAGLRRDARAVTSAG
jgi:cupin fold WbuC family metalloprotein